MTDIDQIKLRRLDLTILLVFSALMRYRRSTDVAERMGLTQSAISHSLKRLRNAFEDPLFLRRPYGLEPTARACELEPEINRAIEGLSAALVTRSVFRPSAFEGPIRIGSYDAIMATLVPRMLSRISKDAPKAQLIVRPISRGDAIEALNERTLDLAIGYFFEATKEAMIEPLYEERYVVVGRKGHRLERASLTPQIFANERHIVVSPKGDLTGVVDEELEKLRLDRHVDAAIPLFLPAMAAVAASDCIATIPKRLADFFAKSFGLWTKDPPISIRPFQVSLVRHRRDAKNGLVNWLAEIAHSAV
jgi:DNA-binding transcriptional LysR family regulator